MDSKAKKNEDARRAEIRAMFQEFLNGKGRLPAGFSEQYNKTTSSGHIYRGTPFDAYLDEIGKKVDLLKNQSGISEWIYFDGSIEINAAVAIITDWVRLHREMKDQLRGKRHVGNTTIMVPVSTYGHGKIMIVMRDSHAFENITERSMQACKAESISFCIILSELKLYDFIEQKEKELKYVTYPNYHDEIYADWWLE